MYSIEFTQTAEKQFNKLPKDIQIRIINVLERIKFRPFHFVKRKEGTPYFIMRIGDSGSSSKPGWQPNCRNFSVDMRSLGMAFGPSLWTIRSKGVLRSTASGQ